MANNGMICIDKPRDFTSFDVVAKLRGIAKTKKVGHGGTLDPMATGVLPLFLGSATKACDLMPDHSKRYRATFRLGTITDTQDITGTVLERRPVEAGREQVGEGLKAFLGELDQIPPMYSAVKVGGRRLYDLARQGMEVERKARRVHIHRLELLEWDEAEGEYVIDVLCSKGTYIRTLCHDLGLGLGCGAVLTDLRRTMACGFTLEDCVTLEQAQSLADRGALEQALLPVEAAFASLPRLELTGEQAWRFCNGTRLALGRLPPLEGDGMAAVFGETGLFLGLAAPDREAGLLVARRVFARAANGEHAGRE